MKEMQVRALGQEDPLEKEMATHSSIIAWKIPWTEEPGELPFMKWQKAGHTTKQLSAHTHISSDSPLLSLVNIPLTTVLHFGI